MDISELKTKEDVQEWLKSGGDVNKRDSQGRTNFINVARDGTPISIKTLIEAGA